MDRNDRLTAFSLLPGVHPSGIPTLGDEHDEGVSSSVKTANDEMESGTIKALFPAGRIEQRRRLT